MIRLKAFTYHQAVRNVLAEAEQLIAALQILKAASDEYPEADEDAHTLELAPALDDLRALLKEG